MSITLPSINKQGANYITCDALFYKTLALTFILSFTSSFLFPAHAAKGGGPGKGNKGANLYKPVPVNILNANNAMPGKYEQEYLPGTVIIKVRPEYRSSCGTDEINIEGFRRLKNDYGFSNIKKQYPNAEIPAVQTSPYAKPFADLSLIYRLNFSAKESVEEVIRALYATNLFTYAEPSFKYKHCATINDPDAANQYHLNILNMYAAWDISMGDTNVVIGIVDSGTDTDHPDLIGNIKYNYLDPIDGLDNDNDGFIDNFRGWDVAGSNLNNIVGDNDPGIKGRNNVHGSHVSGIAAAATNNGTGGAGIAYKCKFMPVKCAADNDSFPPNFVGYIIAGYEGIVYAADHGCRVINCSWGGGGYSQQGQDVITYATINKNSLVVCAAGNDNSTADFYPADFDGVVSVAASNSADVAAGFTNHNYKVAVTAPGENIYSTIFDNVYSYASGTSMASPVVAGLAALSFSVHSNYNPEQMRLQLMASSDAGFGARNPAETYTDRLGSGRVSAPAALTMNPSGVVMRNISAGDHNDNVFQGGDTLYISGAFLNILFPSQSSGVKIYSNSAYLIPVADSVMLGVMQVNEVRSANDVFKFLVAPNIPDDHYVSFNIRISDIGQSPYRQTFDMIFHPSFRNLNNRNVSTTISSIGRIGYVRDNATTGLGFRYKGKSMAYEMGLMTATSAGKLANTVRNAANGYDQDFAYLQTVGPRTPEWSGADALFSIFNDAGAGDQKIGVEISQTSIAPHNAADSNLVIVNYVIKNTNPDTIRNYFIGLFADFDVSSSGAQDHADYDAGLKLGHVHDTQPGGVWAGIANYKITDSPAFNAIQNNATGSTATDFGIYDGFSDAEKVLALTSGTARTIAPAAPANAGDVGIVCGAGPFTIAPNDTISTGFIIIAGQSLESLQASVPAGRSWDVVMGNTLQSETVKLTLYPNPAADKVYISGTGISDGSLVNICDAIGKNYTTALQKSGGRYFINTDILPTGLYTVRLAGKGNAAATKVSVRH
ncbi:MAG: S8 family peptidase [Bacteroidota bacterium]